MVTRKKSPIQDPIARMRSYGFRELLSLVYSLKPAEIEMYLYLLGNPMLSVDEIASQLDRERSGVNRIVSNLHKKNFVVRHFRIGKKGGYTYLCEARDLEEIKAELSRAVEDFALHTRRLLDGIWAEDLAEGNLEL